jgi:hypothetical protein
MLFTLFPVFPNVQPIDNKLLIEPPNLKAARTS